MPEPINTILEASGRPTSRIGLGMATLMREPSRSVRRAVLERAYELGVRHFDVAPLYGLGRAEPELGAFLVSNSITDATVATKFGLAPSRKARLVAPFQGPIRAAMRRSALIRQLGKSAERSAGTVQSLAPELIGDSIQRSLESLAMDSVDVLILHEVLWDQRWDRAWQSIQESPKYRGLGVSGTAAILAGYPPHALVDVSLVQGPPTLSDTAVTSQRIYHSVLNDLVMPLAAAVAGLSAADRRLIADVLGRTLDASGMRCLAVTGLLAADPRSIVLVGTTRIEHLNVLVRDVGVALGHTDAAVQSLLATLLETARSTLP